VYRISLRRNSFAFSKAIFTSRRSFVSARKTSASSGKTSTSTEREGVLIETSSTGSVTPISVEPYRVHSRHLGGNWEADFATAAATENDRTSKSEIPSTVAFGTFPRT
jgi:hypothetical protein